MERIKFQNVPSGMFDKLMTVETYINESSLEIKLLEIIRLRVAQINGCAYCVDQHYKELKHAGESELRLSSLCIWDETPYYSEMERAVLSLTESLTRLDSNHISDELFNELDAHFSKEEIAYLTLAIAQINVWTRLMKTFRFTPGKFEVRD